MKPHRRPFELPTPNDRSAFFKGDQAGTRFPRAAHSTHAAELPEPPRGLWRRTPKRLLGRR